MDFSKYKFRCSSLGYIMSPVKGKSYQQLYDEKKLALEKANAQVEGYSEKAIKGKAKAQSKADKLSEELDVLEPLIQKVQLSETAKTHLCDIYTSAKYGRHTEDLKSKYLEKGLHMEEDAITLYSLVTGEFHKKNDEEKENDWIKGHIDFPSLKKKIVDTKVNWSIYQFNRVVAKPIKPLYAWQGKGYMWLWDMEEFDLAYCLLNTPEHLIKREETKLLYELIGRKEITSKEEEDLCRPALEELRRNHIYDDISDEEKIRVYTLQRNTDDEEMIKAYVEAAREYLNNFGKDNENYN